MIRNMCIHCLKERSLVTESVRFFEQKPEDKLVSFRCTDCQELISVIIYNIISHPAEA
ncbi:hypothetical protein SAMN03159332_0116 [Paenibacillus sp. 276b]|nr:hypothetical protein SAMN03159332_0116 [Paenibacillus sp. 276b]